nr:hypothetical protein [Mucilaginibacter sp. E4BP6]
MKTANGRGPPPQETHKPQTYHPHNKMNKKY